MKQKQSQATCCDIVLPRPSSVPCLSNAAGFGDSGLDLLDGFKGFARSSSSSTKLLSASEGTRITEQMVTWAHISLFDDMEFKTTHIADTRAKQLEVYRTGKLPKEKQTNLKSSKSDVLNDWTSSAVNRFVDENELSLSMQLKFPGVAKSTVATGRRIAAAVHLGRKLGNKRPHNVDGRPEGFANELLDMVRESQYAA